MGGILNTTASDSLPKKLSKRQSRSFRKPKGSMGTINTDTGNSDVEGSNMDDLEAGIKSGYIVQEKVVEDLSIEEQLKQLIDNLGTYVDSELSHDTYNAAKVTSDEIMNSDKKSIQPPDTTENEYSLPSDLHISSSQQPESNIENVSTKLNLDVDTSHDEMEAKEAKAVSFTKSNVVIDLPEKDEINETGDTDDSIDARLKDILKMISGDKEDVGSDQNIGE